MSRSDSELSLTGYELMATTVSSLVAKTFYWAAQISLPLGKPGMRIARSLLATALVYDPRLDRARGWRSLIDGTLARERGDLDAAVASLRDASAVLPDNDAVTANLGIALALAGRYDEAVIVIERAMRGDTDVTGEPQIWMALAWAHLRTGRSPKALEACERAEESRATSVDLRILRILALASCRGFVQRDELRNLLRMRARMLPLVLEHIEQLAVSGSRDVARQLVRGLPDSIQTRALQVIVRSAMAGDNLEAAHWAIRELEIRQPDSATAPTLRSELALRRKDHHEALSEAMEAVRRKPQDAQALDQLVRVRVLRGEGDQAAREAVEAVQRRGGGGLTAGVAALHYLEAQDLEAAQRVFAVQRSGDELACAFAAAAQALLHARRKHHAEALRQAERSVSYAGRIPAWAHSEYSRRRIAECLRETLELSRASGEEVPEALAQQVASLQPPKEAGE